MRSNIFRRLMHVEQKAHIHDPPQPVIFVRFVSPGQPYQSSRAECDGQVWERALGELEEAFQRRVFERLMRDERSPTIVIFHPARKTEVQRMSEFAH
jgi:hypothetical protein